MKTSELKKWVNEGLISQEQADKLLLAEQSAHSNLAWAWMYGIAGLFMGLGIILLVGSNWESIPNPLKLFGDFLIWGVILYGTYLSILNKNSKIKELFLVLSFLFVGATIGLIGQIFNLSGGWYSYAMVWSLLGLPFVLFSRLLSFNFCWLFLFFSLFDFEWFDKLFDYMDKHADGIVLAVIFLSLLSYAGKKLDESLHKYTLLPKAFQKLTMFMAYVVVFQGIFIDFWWPFYILAFLFFGIRMFWAFKTQNMLSFKRNAIAVEIYLFLIFATRFGDLLWSGYGFILGGACVLLLIYLFRATSKHIKTLEIFHE